ncbi:uncharacterized protein LOC130745766 [Lotus japonicus]|uniref:uncharacterized protein LOC130745766 n=1 Tax=Lotus japonicus TaxID=34305 RepID=UPI00258E4CB7|nr:uncharacterized protein LOC130745766 [Lotus japonicus]
MSTESKDNWVEMAMADDSLVANLLLSFNRSESRNLTVQWPIRHRRSQRRKSKFARTSPSTPLSLTAAATASDDSTPPAKPLDDAGSKAGDQSETASAKRTRKRRTLPELLEKEKLLLKESADLENQLKSLTFTVDKHRFRNQRLKSKMRMKVSVSRQSSNIVATSLVSEKAVHDPPQLVKKAHQSELVLPQKRKDEALTEESPVKGLQCEGVSPQTKKGGAPQDEAPVCKRVKVDLVSRQSSEIAATSLVSEKAILDPPQLAEVHQSGLVLPQKRKDEVLKEEALVEGLQSERVLPQTGKGGAPQDKLPACKRMEVDLVPRQSSEIAATSLVSEKAILDPPQLAEVHQSGLVLSQKSKDEVLKEEALVEGLQSEGVLPQTGKGEAPQDKAPACKRMEVDLVPRQSSEIAATSLVSEKAILDPPQLAEVHQSGLVLPQKRKDEVLKEEALVKGLQSEGVLTQTGIGGAPQDKAPACKRMEVDLVPRQSSEIAATSLVSEKAVLDPPQLVEAQQPELVFPQKRKDVLMEKWLLEGITDLKNQLVSLTSTVDKHRARNQSLKRMKVDVESRHSSELAATSLVSEKAVLNPPQLVEAQQPELVWPVECKEKVLNDEPLVEAHQSEPVSTPSVEDKVPDGESLVSAANASSEQQGNEQPENEQPDNEQPDNEQPENDNREPVFLLPDLNEALREEDLDFDDGLTLSL